MCTALGELAKVQVETLLYISDLTGFNSFLE